MKAVSRGKWWRYQAGGGQMANSQTTKAAAEYPRIRSTRPVTERRAPVTAGSAIWPYLMTLTVIVVVFLTGMAAGAKAPLIDESPVLVVFPPRYRPSLAR